MGVGSGFGSIGEVGSGVGASNIGSLCVGVEALGGCPFLLYSFTPFKGMLVL